MELPETREEGKTADEQYTYDDREVGQHFRYQKSDERRYQKRLKLGTNESKCYSKHKIDQGTELVNEFSFPCIGYFTRLHI